MKSIREQFLESYSLSEQGGLEDVSKLMKVAHKTLEDYKGFLKQLSDMAKGQPEIVNATKDAMVKVDEISDEVDAAITASVSKLLKPT